MKVRHGYVRSLANFSNFCGYLKPSLVVLLVKNLPAKAGDARDRGLIPGLGKSPGEGNGNPLQHSCLENPTDRGAWCTTVHGCKQSDMTERTLTHVTKLKMKWRG